MKTTTWHRAIGVPLALTSVIALTGMSPAPHEQPQGDVVGEGVIRILEAYAETSDTPGLSLEELNSVDFLVDEGGAQLSLGSSDGIEISLPFSEESEQLIELENLVAYALEDGMAAVAVEAAPSPDEEVLEPGVRALIAIGSAEAPAAYDFPIALPDDHVLQAQEDGSVHGLDPATGEIGLVVPAPWALDAEGHELFTWYEINGPTLTQHVNFTADTSFPILADPVWFVPLIVAGGRVIGQAAIRAASKAAAQRQAAAIAAKKIIKTVSGKIPRDKIRRCGVGAGIASGTSGSTNITVKKRGDGRWHVRVDNQSTIVAAGVGGCLSANIR